MNKHVIGLAASRDFRRSSQPAGAAKKSKSSKDALHAVTDNTVRITPLTAKN